MGRPRTLTTTATQHRKRLDMTTTKVGMLDRSWRCKQIGLRCRNALADRYEHAFCVLPLSIVALTRRTLSRLFERRRVRPTAIQTSMPHE